MRVRAWSGMCWHGGRGIEAGMSASMPEPAATTGTALGSGKVVAETEQQDAEL